MSFYAEAAGGGSGAAPAPAPYQATGTGEASDFNVLSQEITSKIFDIAYHISLIEQTVTSLGTSRDGEGLRKKMRDHRQETQALVNDAERRLQSLSRLIPRGVTVDEKKHRRLRYNKLRKDYMQQCARFKEVSLSASRAEKQVLATTRQHLRSLERQRRALEDDITHDATPVGMVEDRRKAEIQALEDKVAYTASIAEEQAQGVVEIERGVNKISEIMTEIAVMVDTQGQDLDTFDDHCTRAADSVEDGVSDLRVAEKRQKKAHKKTCFLFMLVAIICVVVVFLITANIVSFF